MARAVEQVSPLGRVQIKEDPGNNNGLLPKKRIEEVKTIRDIGGLRERWMDRSQVKPDVESRLGDILDAEADRVQARQDVVALRAKVDLEGFHLLVHERRFKHRNSRFLKWNVGTTVKVGTGGAQSLDELFRTNDPGDTPTWKAESLGETIDQENIFQPSNLLVSYESD